LALELERHGFLVALLESGGFAFDPDTHILNDGLVTGHEDGTDLAAIRLRYLGGATNHWGGLCLPLDRIDFERAPLSGLTGWPVSQAEMQPFYRRAHDYTQIGRFEYDPLRIGDVTEEDLLLPESEIVRTTVTRMSEVQFGPVYEAALRRSESIHLWTWTNATELHTNDDGTVDRISTRTLSGVERDFPARVAVLACGAVENARQLLAHNARTGQHIGDAGGFVGQTYMDHPRAGAGFLWPEAPIAPKAHWNNPEDVDGIGCQLLWSLQEEVMEREGLSNMHFYLRPYNEDRDPRIREANRGWAALRDTAKWMLGRGDAEYRFSEAYCQAINNADAMAADVFGAVDRTADTQRVLLVFEAEQRPERSNRVTLSTSRDTLGQQRADLHWIPSREDRDAVIRSTILIGQATGIAGLGRIELEDHFDEPFWGTNTSWHQMGTTRMAERPEDGVVSANCQVHGTTNLYVAGGSVMPTSGRANPTLTIVALSVRLADHLQQRLQT
jgi:choline dehydrogenase-like flavoprotein